MNPVEEDDAEAPARPVYVLVDGENIDATLGTSILGHRPAPGERPRWDRLMKYVERSFGTEVTGLFFLAANGELPMSFVQALLAMDWRPVPLSGDPGQKVVDIAIIRTMETLREREGDVVLVSGDGDFLEGMGELVDGERRLAVIGFTEFRNAGFNDLKARGVELIDLEYDVQAFRTPLPRVRIIPIDEFDPTQFI
ncbi:NYN domain-containing protein [Nocardioidaceae bacterium]|nr:NYN domain-containing protein [Nocardioidaceae bacterium]